MHSSGSSQGSKTPSPPLQRGKACLSCRRRKMKCDGLRPTCTPCLRAERIEDCEYTDGTHRPRTLALEEDIARLKARIEELEHPQDVASPVELRAPYVGSHGSGTGRHGPVQAPPMLSSISGSGDSSRGLVQGDVRQTLAIIAPYASELGLFLNLDRLRARGTYILPALHTTLTLWSLHISPPQPPRQPSIYTSTPEQKHHMESHLLSQAQTQLSDALATSNMEPDPQFFMHIVQCSVLLAGYLQRVGQPLGARYHASSALSLAFTLRLHKRSGVQAGDAEMVTGSGTRTGTGARAGTGTGARTGPGTGNNLFDFVGYPELGVPVDAVEEKERVDGFWTVYALERWLGAIYGGLTLTGMGGGVATITTPWPGAERSQSHEGQNTVTQFLNGRNQSFGNDDGLALQAKASVLLGEAASIAASYNADHTISQSPVFRNRFAELDTLIQRFAVSLPALLTSALATTSTSTSSTSMSTSSFTSSPTSQSPPAPARHLLLTLNLISLAQITLHRPFLAFHAGSRGRCVEGVMWGVGALERVGRGCLGVVSPVHSIIWTAMCLVLHEEVLRLRSRHASGSASGSTSRSVTGSGSVREEQEEDAEEGEMVGAIRRLVRALNEVSQSYPSRFFVANFEALLPVLESIAG